MTETMRNCPAFASVYTTLILSPLKALPFYVRFLALGWAVPRPWSTLRTSATVRPFSWSLLRAWSERLIFTLP